MLSNSHKREIATQCLTSTRSKRKRGEARSPLLPLDIVFKKIACSSFKAKTRKPRKPRGKDKNVRCIGEAHNCN
jgi:hypothetical protein